MIGLDMGISALFTTSDGVKVENPKLLSSRPQGQTAVCCSVTGPQEKGSANPRQGTAEGAGPAGTRRQSASDYLHQLSTELVRKL